VLAAADLPAFVPSAEIARDTFDKYAAHELLLRHGLPSPPTVLPPEEPDFYPVMVKPRQGSGARSIHPAADHEEMEFFIRYVKEPVMVQRLMQGPEFSIDILSDLEGRCLNAIPRTMIESKGGESIKGMTIKDWDLIEHGRFVAETLGLRGPANVQCFREGDEHQVTDINPRFGGAFPLPRAAGSNYPELAIALANGERPEPRLGDFREGIVMTRFFSHLILAPGPDGTLEPVDEELPEPLVGDPGEA
jgi:carbamoyl-phosphate synthase large subunit